MLVSGPRGEGRSFAGALSSPDGRGPLSSGRRYPVGVAQGKPDRSVHVDLEPLLVATRTINAIIVRSLAAVDASLSMPQLRVMVILSHHEPASLSEVAAELGIDPSSASRTCDQLVKRGLVEREPAANDRRRLSLRLSSSGRRLLQRVMSRRAKLLAEIVAAMPDAEQHAFMAAMDTFNQASIGLKNASGDDNHPVRALGRLARPQVRHPSPATRGRRGVAPGHKLH